MFFNALQIFNTTMIARNMVKDQAIIQIAMGVINVVLSFWFSRMWGVIGAAFSIFVAYSFRVIMTLMLVRKKLKTDLGLYFRNCYLKMGTAVLMTGLVAIPMLWCIGDGSWLQLLAKIAVVTMLYGVSQVLIGLTKNERKLLKSKLLRFR
jgi:O-antigen/teichoic acid export membrane protein